MFCVVCVGSVCGVLWTPQLVVSKNRTKYIRSRLSAEGNRLEWVTAVVCFDVFLAIRLPL